MSGLGRHWRLRVNNTQNQAITVAITGRLGKYDSNGEIVYSSELTLFGSASVAATSGSNVGATQDNTVVGAGWLWAQLTVSMTAAAATNGTGDLTVQLETSTDGGTTWPSAGRGLHVGGDTLVAGDGTSAQRRNMRIR